MKKNFQLLLLVSIVVIWQSCGTKTTDNTTGTTETTTDTLVMTTDEVSAETNKNEVGAAKREAIEKASVEKAEQRRLAIIELAKTSPTFKDASGKVVYNKAEIDPSFVGGDQEMKKYLRANLKYPEAAQDNGVEGTVFVDFIVDQSGNVREVIASDVVGELVELTLQEEAVRVVSSMPKWIPGSQGGKPVGTQFSIPITFQLSN